MVDAGEPWDRFKIKAEVQRRGATLTQIAQDAGLSDSACRVALLGGSRSGAMALSAFLGVPMRHLFPGLYLRARPTLRQSTKQAASESRKNRSGAADVAGAAR